MTPIYYWPPVCGSTQEPRCFYYYKLTTQDGGDPNWSGYRITSSFLGIDQCSNLINPADPSGGGVYNYALTAGINGISDVYLQEFSGPQIGMILSYYGGASQQSFYDFIITNSLNTPISTGWIQGPSCDQVCFEHPIKKPNTIVRDIQLDSADNLHLLFLPSGGSPWTLDVSNAADIANFEKILQNIYGPQVVVTTQTTPSGNIILQIKYVYTDQIILNMSNGDTHTMSIVSCG